MKKPTFDSEDFFKDLSYDLRQEFASEDNLKDIITFTETEIDKERWGIELTVQQRALLKAFYSLPLLPNEEEVLLEWVEADKTTWSPLSMYQALVVECGRRGGKCVSVDTLINTDEGLKYGHEILEDVKSKYGLSGLTPNTFYDYHIQVPQGGSTETTKTECFFYKGFSKTYTITTNNGYTLEGTAEHRILVIDTDGNHQWRYLDEVRKGDYVCIQTKSSLFPDTSPPLKSRTTDITDPYLNEDWASLLALYVLSRQSLSTYYAHYDYPPSSPELCFSYNRLYSDYYQSFLDNTVNSLPIDQTQRFYKAKSGISYVITHSSDYKSFIRDCLYPFQLDDNIKRLPYLIRCADKRCIIAFLRVLFTEVGFATTNQFGIRLRDTSDVFIREIQVLLLSLGIISRIRKSSSNSSTSSFSTYKLILTGYLSAKRFSEQIGFMTTSRQRTLDKYVNRSRVSKDKCALVPHQSEWVTTLRQSIPDTNTITANSRGGEHRPLRGVRSRINSSCPLNATSLNRWKLQDLTTLFDNHNVSYSTSFRDHIHELVDCDYYYDEITSITDGHTECFDFSVPESHHYIANGFVSHNSSLASVIVVYEFYRLCHLPSPQLYYKISASTPISILVLATSSDQAKRTIFKNVIGMIRVCSYFDDLVRKGKIYVGKEAITYDDKLLYIYSGNSQSGSQVGQSVILLVMDEVSRFRGEEGDEQALELWSNIGISGVSFGTDAKRMAISSAWFEGDAIQRLWNNSKIEESWLGFRLKTWDLNPTASRDNPTIASEYSLNARKAALEFEGIRTEDECAFFNFNEVKAAVKGTSTIQARQVNCDDGLVRVIIDTLEQAYYPSHLHLDPSISRDTYGLAFGHGVLNSELNIVVTIDGILGWTPSGGCNVSLVNVVQTVLEINRKRPLNLVTADHHNSAECLERMRLMGLRAKSLFFNNKLQMEMYEATRLLMHEGRLILPKDGPWTGLMQEEMRRVLLHKETKIIHPPSGCFTGETLIPLLDGTKVMISELVGKEVWVHSCNKSGFLMPGRARGRLTKYTDEIVEVLLSNGATICCTPEHPFRLRSGRYVEAKRLNRIRSKLMTLYPEDYNVSVISVTPIKLDKPVPVYDLEVPKWENFALAAGVFVHNSKDICDSICGVVWTLLSEATKLPMVSSVGSNKSTKGTLAASTPKAPGQRRSVLSRPRKFFGSR